MDISNIPDIMYVCGVKEINSNSLLQLTAYVNGIISGQEFTRWFSMFDSRLISNTECIVNIIQGVTNATFPSISTYN